jgi:phage shock protein A
MSEYQDTRPSFAQDKAFWIEYAGELEKKVESLQAECNQFSETWDKQQASIKSLQADVARYRDALEVLSTRGFMSFEQRAAYAAEALEPTTEKDE